MIRKVRSLTLMHDVQAIRQESKTRSDEVRGHNRQEMTVLADKIGEVENLIEESLREVQGL